MPTNLVAHHVKVLQEAGLVVRTRSEGDRRRTYLRLDPQVLASLTPPALRAAERVVFVCTHNSARSQLAAALWRDRVGGPLQPGRLGRRLVPRPPHPPRSPASSSPKLAGLLIGVGLLAALYPGNGTTAAR